MINSTQRAPSLLFARTLGVVIIPVMAWSFGAVLHTMMSDRLTGYLIDVGFLLWFVSAIAVVWHVGVVVWRGIFFGEIDDRWWFAAGLFLTWSGSGIILRGWYFVFRELTANGVDAEWMRDYPSVLIGVMMVLAGSLLHVRSFTVRDHGERRWLAVLVVLVTVMLAHAAFRVASGGGGPP